MRLSRTLSSYIGRQFLLSFLAFTVGLILIITIFDALELFRRFSVRQGDVAYHAVISMALLKAPTMVEKAIPFSALLGSMYAFWRLNRHHEFVVARAAGDAARLAFLPRRVVTMVVPQIARSLLRAQ